MAQGPDSATRFDETAESMVVGQVWTVCEDAYFRGGSASSARDATTWLGRWNAISSLRGVADLARPTGDAGDGEESSFRRRNARQALRFRARPVATRRLLRIQRQRESLTSTADLELCTAAFRWSWRFRPANTDLEG